MKNIFTCLLAVFLFFPRSASALDPLPQSWLDSWQSPPPITRPLQMVHGRDLTDPSLSVYYRDQCGLGGLVVNVGGKGYIRDPQNWKRFTDGARTAADTGLRLWIYDEDGYPSLEAGGVVLEENPELVSKELVWDKDAPDPFYVRDCYEFTHSCNNYAAARRYPNPLEPKSTQKFLEVTHARYKAELGEELYNRIEAFFTDEPSMMAANLGLIPEEARTRVRIDDPLDPDKKNLPMLPWCSDLETKYLERYGEELRPHFLSLFTGDSDTDREVRGRYWRLIEDLYAERYFGTIRSWCRENGKPVSSGHTLHEETIRGHVPLDGNKMRTLKSLDIPGLDQLNSDPGVANYSGWMASGFPCSAAQMIGQRRVMSELSDFGQINGKEKRPVYLEEMESATAWEMAWGVTDFMLYYHINEDNVPYRNETTHKEYCQFVGRINSILLDAAPLRPVLLYYPIEVFQQEFKPAAECINGAVQSDRMEKALASFTDTGNALQRAGIPFTIIDGDSILELDSQLLAQRIAVIIPEGVTLPPNVSAKLNESWKMTSDSSERIISITSENRLDTQELAASALGNLTGPRLLPEPMSIWFSEGTFERDGKLIFLYTNLAADPWEGTLKFLPADTEYQGEEWIILNPQTGEITEAEANEGQIPVNLKPRESLLLITK